MKLQAHPGDRVDEVPAVPVVAELSAQAVHGDPHAVARGSVVVSPDVLRQPCGRHDGAPVPHEVVKEPELRARQATWLAVDVEDPLRQVEPERAHLEDLWKLRLPREIRAPHVRSQSGDELAVAEGLDDVIVRADVESADLVLLLVQPGEHDDG